MAGIRSLTADGSETEVAPEAIAALGETLRGRVLTSDDAEYGDARQIWNGMIDRRPSLIARCIDTADVMHCVQFAREHGLLVSVKGGGHNVARAVHIASLPILLALPRPSGRAATG